jgi:hypothetical protein
LTQAPRLALGLVGRGALLVASLSQRLSLPIQLLGLGSGGGRRPSVPSRDLLELPGPVRLLGALLSFALAPDPGSLRPRRRGR